MMKSAGIVRKVDELGRIVIPKELRRTMEFEEGTPLEIYTDGDKIILKIYAPGCTLCGNMARLVFVGGKPVCVPCIIALQKQALLDQAATKRDADNG